MDLLSGKILVKKTGEEVQADDALEGKDIIAFYFSAHWCPPCRAFTPILADFYEELTEAGKPFEVVFVTSDRSSDAMFDYMKECHGDWLAVPHGSSTIDELSNRFGVQGIPLLIVVKRDGTIITENGRGEVQSKGARVFAEWAKK